MVDTVATATAGEMPTKISNGVIRNPPPMPNIAGNEADRNPHSHSKNTLTGSRRSEIDFKVSTERCNE